MRAASDLRDATLISVLGYAGLHPQEALALCWRDVGERTMMINAMKTGQRRNVRALAPLLEDLNAWREAQRPSNVDALVFPGHDGVPWTVEAYKSWSAKQPRGRKRKRQKKRAGSPGPFHRAAKTAGVPSATRTRCVIRSACFCCTRAARSFTSLVSWGMTRKLTLSTYGHVIDEFEDAPRVPTEEAIWAARRGPCVTGLEREAAS
jgi:integrase